MNRKPELQLVRRADANGVNPLEWMARKLRSIGDLTYHEHEAIMALAGMQRELRAYEDVVREGDRPDVVCLVVSGLLCRYKLIADGSRQLISFHFPGDVPDAMSLFMERMDHTLCTLTPATIFQIPHGVMHTLFREHPGIATLFWRSTLIEAAIFREWMVGLGRRNAYSRLARLLCELVTLMKAVGLSDGSRCHLPVTQAELADAAGLSTVHVNRTLQELRSNGLISFQGGSLEVLDWPGLVDAGDFDANYLHLKQ